MAAIVVIDLLAQPYDEAGMLTQPLGGTQSAVMDTCINLAEQVDTVLYNGVESPRAFGSLRILPNRQITLAELTNAKWIVFVSWVTQKGLEQLPLRKGGPRVALWAHHDIDQHAVGFLAQPAALRYFSKYLFVSRWQRDRYAERFRIDAEAATVIGNPYCERALAQIGPLDKTFDRPRLIYTSTPFRGLGLLVDAFPLFAQRYPDATLTVLSGMELYGSQDNSPYQDIFAKIERTPGISLFKPTGKLELYRRMSEANLFAFPSTFPETFCIAALEARVLGNPLLLTRLGALPEVFDGARFFDSAGAQPLAPESWAEFMACGWEEARTESGRAALDVHRMGALQRHSPEAVAGRFAAALALEGRPLSGSRASDSAVGNPESRNEAKSVSAAACAGRSRSAPRVFGMVTMSRSHFYTKFALASFFERTPLRPGDRLILIDNDGDYQATCDHPALTLVRNAQPRGFAANLNAVLAAAREGSADVVFLNNDIIFTKDWLGPISGCDDQILIPASNQNFQYQSPCGRLKLSFALDWSDFGEQYALLDAIVEAHKHRFPAGSRSKSLLMPFYCFHLPARIYGSVGDFDENFGVGGGEDVDYRIRCLTSGFDVGVALHSYLLHFQGKSTWRGGENGETTSKRDTAYRDVFRRKWGDDIATILLAGTGAMERLTRLGLRATYERGDFRAIVEECLRRA